MEFRILGPLEVRDRQRTIELGAAKQRALLGVLLLHANQLVSTSRLVEELWGEHPPATAEKLVQGYVHALRKRLGADLIATKGSGYTIDLGSNRLDVLEFERLVAEARDAPPREAIELRKRALALWRGPPLADVVLDGSARAALGRLEDLRLGLELERIEGELELGSHAAHVGELESIAAEHPYDERAHALLMLALYRSGRQADALASYRALRRRLDEELGLQPGQELRDLEAAILRQDEGLARPARDDEQPVPIDRPAAPRRAPSARTLVLAGTVALGLVAAAVTTAVLRDDPRSVSVAPNSVAVIDPSLNRVVATVPVGIGPGPIAAGAGAVWVGNVDDRSLTRVAPGTREVVRNVPLPATPTGIAVGAAAVWVAHGRRGQLTKLDPAFDRVTRTIDVTRTSFGTSTGGVDVGFGAVWAVFGDSTFARVDPSDARRTGATFAGIAPVDVVVGAGSVWVAQGGEPTVERFHPATFEVGPVRSPITVGNRPSAIAFGEDAVWVANSGDDTVSRIDPESNAVRSIPVGDEPSGIAVGAGAIWVANAGDGTVSRIDPETYELVTIDVGAAPAGIAVAGGRVWVTVREP